MHADDRDKVVLAVQQQRRWKPKCVGGSWIEFIVASSVATTHIYRGEPARITMSRNRFDLYKNVLDTDS
jgi:hypothetical protein